MRMRASETDENGKRGQVELDFLFGREAGGGLGWRGESLVGIYLFREASCGPRRAEDEATLAGGGFAEGAPGFCAPHVPGERLASAEDLVDRLATVHDDASTSGTRRMSSSSCIMAGK